MTRKCKILLLTNVYPSLDLDLLNSTSVCHYFAREWVKLGCEVRVIYSYPIYMRFFHWLAHVFEARIASKGAAFVATKRITQDTTYVLEGVTIHRFPIYKLFPRMQYSPKRINVQIDKIIQSNLEVGFVPDIITGHFPYQNIEIINKLKEIYGAKACMILHGNGDKFKEIYPNNYRRLIDRIDIWGYRSLPIKKQFENQYGSPKKSFMCYSGIPEKYLNNKSCKNFNLLCNHFIYVGSLIKRKHPVALITALRIAFPLDDFDLNIIGKGAEVKKIKRMIQSFNLESCIHLLGHLSREQVFEKMTAADCFVMISENETFGLVYLEAMAQGCLVIASEREGMDGIIEHGVNGFLCKAGDAIELSNIIKHINNLSIEERKVISFNALNTVRNLTDRRVAQLYLDAITENINF